jgi:hypothetical protein
LSRDRGIARLEPQQRDAAVVGERQLAVGDRVAVGVVAGVAERRRDPLLEVLGDVVLEHLCLVVDLVPRHPEGIGEIGLDQAVVADHLERHPLARGAQRHPVVGPVLDQTHVRHPLEHRGHGPGRDAEPLGEGRGAHRP